LLVPKQALGQVGPTWKQEFKKQITLESMLRYYLELPSYAVVIITIPRQLRRTLDSPVRRVKSQQVEPEARMPCFIALRNQQYHYE